MEYSVLKIPRPVRRRFKTIVQSHRDGDYRRRASALLWLAEGASISETARKVFSTRKSVRDWKARYEHGEAGLAPLAPGRQAETVTDAVCTTLLELVKSKPQEAGYLSSRWTSQMLAEQLWG